MDTQALTSQVRVELSKAARDYARIRATDSLQYQREKIFLLSLLEAKKDLRECTPTSLVSAMIQAGSMGLTLNPALAHCYLIPRYERSKAQGESWDDFKKYAARIAYASPGYRGLVALAVQQKVVQWVKSEVVHKNDVYLEEGLSSEPTFRVDRMNAKGRGEVVGVFCCAKLANGDALTEWMTEEEVQKVRAKSEAPDSLMWKTFTDEARKKCVIRRAWKLWPNIGNAELFVKAVQHLNDVEPVTAEEKPLALINEQQATELHAILTDHGYEGEKADRQLQRLAKTYKVPAIAQLPAGLFEEAKTKLQAGIQHKVKS